MKSFYCVEPARRRPGSGETGASSAILSSVPESVVLASADGGRLGGSVPHTYIGSRARVAVYDAPASAPYVEEVGPAPAREYIERLSSRVYDLASQRGSSVPYTVIREIAENLLHAGFAEPVISVMDSGSTIRFSDQGPGIGDKDLAQKPGFTTATSSMKEVIRGVGSGLPLVREFLSVTGGTLTIEDNLVSGTVVTVSTSRPAGPVPSAPVASIEDSVAVASSKAGPVTHSPAALFDEQTAQTAGPLLTNRQKHVLALVLESGSAGPSIVSRELGVGLSTAYRDLASLEEMGLISSEGGKRALTTEGLSYLSDISTSS